MKMQTTLGKLTEAVDTLKSDSKSNRDELTKLSKDLHAAKVAVYVVGGCMTVIGGLIATAVGFVGWIIKTYLDYHQSLPH